MMKVIYDLEVSKALMIFDCLSALETILKMNAKLREEIDITEEEINEVLEVLESQNSQENLVKLLVKK